MLAPVVHTCNPSYSEGRDQEDHGSKPSWANSLQDPILRKNNHKKRLAEWLKVLVLSSSPSTSKKNRSYYHQVTTFCSKYNTQVEIDVCKGECY
jgi:hypothetical protein